MKRMIFVVSAILAAMSLWAEPQLISDREWSMIRQIAANYELSEEQTWLLAGIRKLENGRPGLEFGVGGPMNSGHPSHRYQDGFKSFYVQGAWAAGTVKKHYRGDLKLFGKRYCPRDAEGWTRKMSSILTRLKAQNNYRLPGEKPPKRNISFP